MPFAIEIVGLRKMYKGAWTPALDGLTVKVKRNQVMGLLGPNGAGKTTCINILCGLVSADEGMAKVMGKDCASDIEAIRAQIGVVPQQIALFGNLTAWENFRYIGRLYNLSEQEIRERGQHLLERMGL